MSMSDSGFWDGHSCVELQAASYDLDVGLDGNLSTGKVG